MTKKEKSAKMEAIILRAVVNNIDHEIENHWAKPCLNCVRIARAVLRAL